MTTLLRIALVLCSVIMLWYVGHKIRIAKLRIGDGIMWILVSVGFLVISIFPEIIYAIGGVFGIISSVNLVYLLIIAFLLLAVFHNSVKISILESRIAHLTQEVALRDERFVGLETEDQAYLENREARQDKTAPQGAGPSEADGIGH